MTKNYALFLLNQLCAGASVEAMPIIPQFELSQALSVAIKALERKDVLDKIRAEIMSKDGLEEALEIIDKYKAESEENA